MSDQSPSDVIPPSPSAEEYGADATGKPLIPDLTDPVQLFRDWMAAARESEPNDANAMSLATVDVHGRPDVRVVLLKDISAEGFTFYTNFESVKGVQLKDNPVAALGFHWKSLRRQVRVRGSVERVTEAEADTYFASRARISRLSAIASDQSRPLPSRDVFEDRIKALEAEYEGREDIPRPSHWGGYRVVPDEMEFWQDQAFRMHDRLKFVMKNGVWTTDRLYP
ncbi:pyridoxamine 5'-phosphate oxidase [Henriciella aquimarina]|uniref:pyridoxamine 5'-phosphate oxidase n=1 Tax=Henriciella aquimarina TaxID=545261 RepID=UPI0009FF32B8|nr:pyridoxamine 5'-phosphate oxidase [Henriciella aquimarina]